MRAMLAGLVGLCLTCAVPAAGEARTETRPIVQSTGTRTAPAARPPAPAARPAAGAPGRTSSARPAAPTRAAAAQAQRSPTVAPRGAAPAGQQAARTASGRGAAAVPYSARPVPAAQENLRRNAAANCTVRNGRRICGPRETALRWTGGLPPAAMSQASCPDGTMATNAIGHSNVVRCVPL